MKKWLGVMFVILGVSLFAFAGLRSMRLLSLPAFLSAEIMPVEIRAFLIQARIFWLFLTGLGLATLMFGLSLLMSWKRQQKALTDHAA